MLVSTVLCIQIATDDIDSDIPRMPREWYTYQRDVMLHLIQYDKINPILNKEKFPTERNIDDVCRWTGVSCMNSSVIRIEWRKMYAAVLDTRWFPAYTVLIQLYLQKMAGPLDTRYLPKHVDEVSMECCGIRGEVDLTSLPPKIKVLKLPGNQIQGNVSLLYLPDSIRVIDLSENSIVTAYGKDGCLPKGLESINFHSSKAWTKYIAVDGGKKDSRIQAVRIEPRKKK